MYQNFYRFKENPFSLTPDTDLVFPSKKHITAIEHLEYGIQQKKGFILITGEAGSGKTTLCRSFLKNLDKKIEVALILNSFLSEIELLRAINRDFGIDSTGETREQLVNALNDFLIEQKELKKIPVVIVDESQNLSPSVLEQLRMLSNLETDKEKLLQIVLMGQPELEETLERHDLRQLNQRIAIRYKIMPLDFQETQKYIYYRLHAASGGETTASFSRAAMKKIYRASRGIPRNINILCDYALLTAYVQDDFTVSGQMVQKAMRELNWKGAAANIARYVKWPAVAVASCAAVIILVIPVIKHFPLSISFNKNKPAEEIKAAEIKKTAPPVQTVQAVATEKTVPAEPKVFTERKIRSYLELNNALWELARLWEAGNSLPEAYSTENKQLLLNQYGFKSSKTWAGLPILAKINLPCVLEVAVPESDESEYIVLAELDRDRAVVVAENNQRKTLSWSQLEGIWHGRAHILYRDTQKPDDSEIYIQNMRGKGIELLQKRLYALGYLEGGVSGKYDQETRNAVEKFQKAMRFPVDGIAGVETLLTLYRLSDGQNSPQLVKGRPASALKAQKALVLEQDNF